MNLKDIETIIIELSSLLRKAQNYFSDKHLSDRYKTAPDWDKKEYNQSQTFNDFLRQQLVNPFYSKWLKDINRVGCKLKNLSPNDYAKVKLMLDDLPFKELGWEQTSANEMELTMQNLEKIIDYLSKKYGIEQSNRFVYKEKTQKLMRGNKVVIDFKGSDTNQHEVIRQLFSFRNSGKELSSTNFHKVQAKSNRWMYTAQRDINKSVGVNIIQRKRINNLGQDYDVLSLNPDYI